MSYPKAYEPIQDQKYQLLYRNLEYSREYDHLDYAVDKAELITMLSEYRMAYQNAGAYQIKVITLPYKYWKKKQ